MKFLVCSVDVLPCPVSEQSLYSLADIIAQSIAQIEASEIALAYAFGAGSVTILVQCFTFSILTANCYLPRSQNSMPLLLLQSLD